jgi:MoxR-like ATPase
MATQNPIETEGTYPLPEAQVDRFMMKVLIDYPSEDDEFVIVQRVIAGGAQVTGVISPEELQALQVQCRHCYVDPSLIHYAVKLISATRFPTRYGLESLQGYISFGASPRASIGLIEGARALALLRGRDYALPQDLADLVPDILRHRLVLSYTALAEGKTADTLIQEIMKAVPMPDQPLEAHVR